MTTACHAERTAEEHKVLPQGFAAINPMSPVCTLRITGSHVDRLEETSSRSTWGRDGNAKCLHLRDFWSRRLARVPRGAARVATGKWHPETLTALARWARMRIDHRHGREGGDMLTRSSD